MAQEANGVQQSSPSGKKKPGLHICVPAYRQLSAQFNLLWDGQIYRVWAFPNPGSVAIGSSFQQDRSYLFPACLLKSQFLAGNMGTVVPVCFLLLFSGQFTCPRCKKGANWQSTRSSLPSPVDPVAPRCTVRARGL